MVLKEMGAIAATALPMAALSTELRLGYGFADDGAEDALLERLLREAVEVVERRTGLALIKRGFELDLSDWDRNGHLVLPVGPVEALTSLEILEGGVATTLDAASYWVVVGASRQKVTGLGGGALPSLGNGRLARARFDAGFGVDWSDVPEDLARAVLLLAAHGYEHGSASGMPTGVMALLDMRRPVRL